MNTNTDFFTKQLTRELKAHAKTKNVFCNMDADGTIWVTTSYFMVHLTPEEYEKYVRPALQRDAGNWNICNNALTNYNFSPSTLWNAAIESTEGLNYLTKSPLALLAGSDEDIILQAFCNKDDQTVCFYDQKYLKMFNCGAVKLKSKNERSSALVHKYDKPIALLMPCKADKNAILAVQAYFSDITSV